MQRAQILSRVPRRYLSAILAAVLAFGVTACESADDDGAGQPEDGQQQDTDRDTNGY